MFVLASFETLVSKNITTIICYVWVFVLLVMGVLCNLTTPPDYWLAVLPMTVFSFTGAYLSIDAHHDASTLKISFAVIANLLAIITSSHGFQIVNGEISTCNKLYKDEAAMDRLLSGASAEQLQSIVREYDTTSFADYECMGFDHGHGWRMAHLATLAINCIYTITASLTLSVILLLHVHGVKQYLQTHIPAMERVLAEAIGKLHPHPKHS